MKKARFIFCVLTMGLILGVNCLFAQGIWKSFTVEDGLAHNHVWCIKKDLDGNMWFGTKRGLSKMDTNGVWTNYLSEYVLLNNECWITDIEIDCHNHKWMIAGGNFDESPDQRVIEYNDSTFTAYNPGEDAALIQEPVSVGIDSGGFIWIGMMDNYAWQYDGQQWHPFYVWGTRIYDSVWDIVTDRHGKLYFVHDAGISTLDGYIWPGVNTWIEMRHAAFDRQNRMWCASWWNGLRMLQFEPFQWTFYEQKDGLLSGAPLSVAVDSLNAIWIGFEGGVQRFDGHTWHTFTPQNSPIQNEVWAIFVEKQNEKWFGTKGGVCVLYDTTKITYLTEDHFISNPKQFFLFQNFPNPFNSTTRIRYQINKFDQINYSIFNSNAQLVTTIVNKMQQPGIYELNWNATDNFGKEVSSGVYFGVLQVGINKTSQKMLLIR